MTALFFNMNNVEKIAKQNNPVIECKSCGNKFAYNVRFCPYCNSVNEIGDELKFQEELEDIRDDMEDLNEDISEIHEEAIKQEVTKNAKIIIIVSIVVIALLVMGWFGHTVIHSVASKIEDEKTKSEIQWENEIFPMLDELYEKEDFESINDFYDEFYLSSGWEKHSLYFWKHDNFITVYRLYAHILDSIESIEKYPDSIDVQKIDIFENAVSLILTDWGKYDYDQNFSQRDYEYIAKYQEYALNVLKEHYNISEEDLNGMRDELFDPEGNMDYPSGKMCREKVKELTWY